MESRARSLVGLAEQLWERSQAGPLPDQKQVVTNLRYIREQLEPVLRRHSTVKQDADDETLRQGMFGAVQGLYGALESFELALLRSDRELGEQALVALRTHTLQLETIEHSIEDEQAMDGQTL